MIVDGRTYAYVTPEFTLQLPEGRYTMEVERGTEYVPQQLQFSVSAGKMPTLEIALERWIHMAGRGWCSGDTHTHFLSPHAARLEAEGEDLSVIKVLLNLKELVYPFGRGEPNTGVHGGYDHPTMAQQADKARRSASDAAFLTEICERTIRWAKTAARYQNDAQRAEVVALYERARAVYLEQVDAARDAAGGSGYR